MTATIDTKKVPYGWIAFAAAATLALVAGYFWYTKAPAATDTLITNATVPIPSAPQVFAGPKKNG